MCSFAGRAMAHASRKARHLSEIEAASPTSVVDSAGPAFPAPDHVGARARDCAAVDGEVTDLPPPWHQNRDASDC